MADFGLAASRSANPEKQTFDASISSSDDDSGAFVNDSRFRYLHEMKFLALILAAYLTTCTGNTATFMAEFLKRCEVSSKHIIDLVARSMALA